MCERLSSIQDKLAKTPTISPEDIFSACTAKFSSTASQPHDSPGIVPADCVPAGPNNELRPWHFAQPRPPRRWCKPAEQVLTAGSIARAAQRIDSRVDLRAFGAVRRIGRFRGCWVRSNQIGLPAA